MIGLLIIKLAITLIIIIWASVKMRQVVKKVVYFSSASKVGEGESSHKVN